MSEQDPILDKARQLRKAGATIEEVKQYLTSKGYETGESGPPQSLVDRARSFPAQSAFVAPGQKKRLEEQSHRPLLESVDLPFGAQRDLNAAAQGATFGFSDEAAAAFQALLGRKYGDVVKDERAGLSKFREEHPVRSFLDELAGGVVTTGPLAAGKPAATAGARVARAAATGAGTGAIAGAGSAEGGLDARAHGAVHGAKVGAVVGGAAGGVGEVARFLAKKSGKVTPGESADLKLGKSLERDNMTVDDAIDRARDFSDEKPAVVLDVGGKNTQRLGRAVHTQPSKGSGELSEGLTARSHGAEERTINDLIDGVGLGKRQNAFKKAEELIAEQKRLSKPAYDRVRDIEVDDPEILSLFDIPEFEFAHDAVATAERIRPNGAKIKKLRDASDVVQAADQSGVPDAFNAQTLGTLDKMRQYIGEIARGKLESTKINKNTARAMLERLDAATERLDELYPDYEAARAGYGGRAKGMDAYEAGRAHFKMHPDEVVLELKGMTAAERELYRKGAREALTDRIEGRAPNRDPGGIADKTMDRKRLRLLFDDDASFEEFQKRLGEETQMHRTRTGIQGGSPTADKFAELADMAGLPLDAIMQGATGNAGGAIQSMVKSELARRIKARLQGLNEKQADALAERMLAGTKSRDDLVDMLERIKATQAGTAARSARRGSTAVVRANRLGAGVSDPAALAIPSVSADATATDDRSIPPEVLRFLRSRTP